MCTQCEELMINGLRCHETGCPEAWKTRKVECFECGFLFLPMIRGERICPDCVADRESECYGDVEAEEEN